MNRTVKLAALIAVTAGTLGPAAPAQAAPTARTTTISDHPAVVRVVVRFSGSALAFAAAEASDVNPSNRGAAMRVDQPGIGTTASTILGEGVRVRIRDLGNRLRIGMRFKPGRFKYVDYHQRAHRLTIDLYKDRPPVTGAEIRRGEGGCLRLISHADSGGAIRATGTARNLFESTFVLVVRNRFGRIVGESVVTAAGPNWTGTVSYSVTGNQSGTLEGFAASARDGSVACLVQVKVPLAAPLSPP